MTIKDCNSIIPKGSTGLNSFGHHEIKANTLLPPSLIQACPHMTQGQFFPGMSKHDSGFISPLGVSTHDPGTYVFYRHPPGTKPILHQFRPYPRSGMFKKPPEFCVNPLACPYTTRSHISLHNCVIPYIHTQL